MLPSWSLFGRYFGQRPFQEDAEKRRETPEKPAITGGILHKERGKKTISHFRVPSSAPTSVAEPMQPMKPLLRQGFHAFSAIEPSKSPRWRSIGSPTGAFSCHYWEPITCSGFRGFGRQSPGAACTAAGCYISWGIQRSSPPPSHHCWPGSRGRKCRRG